MLRFPEEIILLLYNEARGDFAPGLAPHSLHTVLAGAVLMDLALENRIDTDPEHLVLVDSTPLGDDLLDPILADIVQDTEARNLGYWVAQTAKQATKSATRHLRGWSNAASSNLSPSPKGFSPFRVWYRAPAAIQSLMGNE